MHFGSKVIQHKDHETADNETFIRIATKRIIRRSTVKSVSQPENSANIFQVGIKYHETMEYTGMMSMIRT
jgi:hypothetical protein